MYWHLYTCLRMDLCTWTYICARTYTSNQAFKIHCYSIITYMIRLVRTLLWVQKENHRKLQSREVDVRNELQSLDCVNQARRKYREGERVWPDLRTQLYAESSMTIESGQQVYYQGCWQMGKRRQRWVLWAPIARLMLSPSSCVLNPWDTVRVWVEGEHLGTAPRHLWSGSPSLTFDASRALSEPLCSTPLMSLPRFSRRTSIPCSPARSFGTSLDEEN